MSSIFCCSDIHGYKNRTLSHEQKFGAFMVWARYPKESTVTVSEEPLSSSDATFAVQVVRQVNYGPLESKRYFTCNGTSGAENDFMEVEENWLIDANFQKLNTYKNFKCNTHNKFFEINIYQKDPVNAHHWRANIARPATEIDL
ncbi:hypothetical protein BKA66DRAFT_572422 [Pyrenochaeta sp. MPI-SDFR-AT-0127]|nr:hypothetical protein BKA66DRAFT_572422 [Pyrenochaeta sp. MPI-SDFR-AT-0127]